MVSPVSPDTWIEQGNDLLHDGEAEGAIEYFDKALAADPKNAQAWYSKGCALGELERHAEAANAYLECSRLEPERSMVWYNLGNALQSLEQFDEALNCFEIATQLDPQDA